MSVAPVPALMYTHGMVLLVLLSNRKSFFFLSNSITLLNEPHDLRYNIHNTNGAGRGRCQSLVPWVLGKFKFPYSQYEQYYLTQAHWEKKLHLPTFFAKLQNTPTHILNFPAEMNTIGSKTPTLYSFSHKLQG